LIVLIGGVWGAGTFLGLGPLAESNVISGTVYNAAGEPVQSAVVEIENEDGGNVSLVNRNQGRTETDIDGTYRFELEEGGGNYTITVSTETTDYDPKTGITPTNTNVDFGEQATQSDDNQTNSSGSGFISSLLGSFVDGDSSTDEDSNSTDTETTNNTETTDSRATTENDQSTAAEESQSQSIRYVEGSVVREEDGQTEPVASAMVTLEDSEENVISAEPNETTEEGAYRIENIGMNELERNIESGQIYIIAEKENQFIAEEEVDLSIRNSPYEITQTITVTEEDLV